jgi:hypothetical protein
VLAVADARAHHDLVEWGDVDAGIVVDRLQRYAMRALLEYVLQVPADLERLPVGGRVQDQDVGHVAAILSGAALAPA